jgi:hypothetical protein
MKSAVLLRAEKVEIDWLRHAASLKRVTVVEYIRRAINVQLCADGVDAVLFQETHNSSDRRRYPRERK